MPYLRNAVIANKPPNPNSPYGESKTATTCKNETIELQEIEPGFGEAQKPKQLKRTEPSLVTPQGEAAARAPLVPVHPDQVDQRARELMLESPELYQGENAYPNAYARASEELNYPLKVQEQQQAANVRQEQQGVTAITKLLDKTQKKLQKQGTEIFNLIPGEAYQRSENRVRLATAQGVSTDRATDQKIRLFEKSWEKYKYSKKQHCITAIFWKITRSNEKRCSKP